MSKLWKLTDSTGKTLNDTQWGENVSHSATGAGTELCSNGFIHAYRSKWIAVFINPAHGYFKEPLLWEARGKVVLEDGDLKCGCKTLTTIKQYPLPYLSIEERVKIGIYCALSTYKKESFVAWAKNWLNGTDRSYDSAYAAAYAADAAAAYAANAYAANAAAYAADAAAAYAANAYAYAAAHAANAAAYAANAHAAYAHAAYAAAHAANAANARADFRLLPIIQKVLKQRKAGGTK